MEVGHRVPVLEGVGVTEEVVETPEGTNLGEMRLRETTPNPGRTLPFTGHDGDSDTSHEPSFRDKGTLTILTGDGD